MTGVPVLYNSNRVSKDATVEFKITYSWDSNNPQQTGNVISIYNNETNALVYTNTFNNFYKQECTVPANTLTNGILYKVTVQVITSEGTSKASEPMLFHCYTTPTFVFTNLVQDQVIQSDNYRFELSYSQSEEEELEEYYISVYTSDHTEIYTSSPSYDTETLELSVSGLNNNTAYYVQAFGQTVTGMSIETEMIHVTVRYLQPDVYSLIELSNNFYGGYVTIKSNIVSLRGRVYENGIEVDATYIDNNYVDITDPNKTLKFNEGFNLKDDFTIMLKGYKYVRNAVILSFNNEIYNGYVYYRIGHYNSTGNEDKAFFELKVEGAITYTIQSNYIDVLGDNDLVGFMISKDSNYYELIAYNYGDKDTLDTDKEGEVT